MGIYISTAMRNQILATNPVKTILNLGFLMIYSGAPPTDADQAVTGTLLCKISNASGATGLTLGAVAAGVIPKTSSEVWSGVNAAGGTAGYYRHVSSADTGALSTTEPRIQGVIATAGGDLNISSTALVNGATQTIDNYSIAIPSH